MKLITLSGTCKCVTVQRNVENMFTNFFDIHLFPVYIIIVIIVHTCLYSRDQQNLIQRVNEKVQIYVDSRITADFFSKYI